MCFIKPTADKHSSVVSITHHQLQPTANVSSSVQVSVLVLIDLSVCNSISFSTFVTALSHALKQWLLFLYFLCFLVYFLFSVLWVFCVTYMKSSHVPEMTEHAARGPPSGCEGYLHPCPHGGRNSSSDHVNGCRWVRMNYGALTVFLSLSCLLFVLINM